MLLRAPLALPAALSADPTGPTAPPGPERTPKEWGPMDTFVPPPLGLGMLFVPTQHRACAMAHRSHGLRSSSPPIPPRTLSPLPHPTPPNSRPEGEWACPAHKPGRKRSKELGQLERDQEIRAQAAAGGFRPKPPRTDARYQAPPAVYISGLFFCTWHKTARSS